MKRFDKKIKLKDGNEIPVLGLGTYGLRGDSGIKTIKNALSLDYRHLDTARMYGNEEEVGKAIKDFERENIFITSKVEASELKYKDVLGSVEKSLALLGTDYIDLYLIHWPSEVIPLDSSLKAFNKLLSEYKIKSFGVSNFDKSGLKEALELEDDFELVTVNDQIEFNPFEYPKETLEYCQKHDLSVTAYSPLSQGGVFGNSTLKEIGNNYDKNEGQVALRWLIQKGAVVIPKASSEDHLKENMEIFDFELSVYDVDKIDKLSL